MSVRRRPREAVKANRCPNVIINIKLCMKFNLPLKCDHCAYIARGRRTNRDMYLHKKRIHQEKFCSFCDYKTIETRRFTRHFREVHNLDVDVEKYIYDRKYLEELRLKCNKCTFEASSKPILKQHMKSDHVVFYFCQFCDYRNSVKSVLNDHVKTKHEGFRYECK